MPGPIGWGILGAGIVARLFARGLQFVPDARIAAVASRTSARRREMAQLFPVGRVYGDYASLVSDPAVDVVYVATTNQLHREHCLLSLRGGKPVLCEKPFTITVAEAREVVEVARRQRLFCMEAMWMRFLPLMRALPELLASGLIGEIRALRADFGNRSPFDEKNRFFNPALGGGAMLDLGIYPLSLSFYLLGTPRAVVSQASVGRTGVDEQSAALLEYASGQIAAVSCSLVTPLPTEAVIVGTRGRIHVHTPLYCPRELTVTLNGEAESLRSRVGGRGPRTLPAMRLDASGPQWVRLTRWLRRTPPGRLRFPFEGNGYNYEAAEVMRCLRAGESESAVMPLDETLRIMECMDAIRRPWAMSSSPEMT